jgi:hypothetical protein
MCAQAATLCGTVLPGHEGYDEALADDARFFQRAGAEIQQYSKMVLGTGSVIKYASSPDRKAYLQRLFLPDEQPQRVAAGRHPTPRNPYVARAAGSSSGSKRKALPVPLEQQQHEQKKQKDKDVEHCLLKERHIIVQAQQRFDDGVALCLEVTRAMADGRTGCFHCPKTICPGAGNSCPRGMSVGRGDFACVMCDRKQSGHGGVNFNAFSTCCRLTNVCGKCMLPYAHSWGKCPMGARIDALKKEGASTPKAIPQSFVRVDPMRGLLNYLIRGSGFGNQIDQIYQLMDEPAEHQMQGLRQGREPLILGILRVTRPIWMGNRGSLTRTVESEAFQECANVLSDWVHKLTSPMTVTP